jgi:hypothetical protein
LNAAVSWFACASSRRLVQFELPRAGRAQVEPVLSQAGTQKAARAVSGAAQDGAVGDPHHDGGAGEENPESSN